jgi:indolepyruvate ferredoxin oxidoreductase, beta subunit
MTSPKTTNIIIAALGGEGGGVLADWLTEVATSQGYLAQSTSVPGVAQRTGATIYYIELFPKPENTNDRPVMSLFPTQGDVDIVIASEIVEAGRMVQRGFVTPERTTLITSDHRVFSVGEKIIPGNGIIDSDEVRKIAKAKAQRFIHDDMKALALTHNTVISATLFGALAGSGALPFTRDVFEDVIRRTGKAVEANLAAFGAMFERVETGDTDAVQPYAPAANNSDDVESFVLPEPTTTAGAQLLDRIREEFDHRAHQYLYLGVKRLLTYQDAAYANQYLDQLGEINHCESNQCENNSNGQLLQETARYLALWMSYEDIVRVAQIKITSERFARFATEINIEADQYYNMVEFLRPQIEEYVSILPASLAEKILASPFWQKLIGRFTQGKFVSTNKLSGFLQFYLLAQLKPLRRKSWGYKHEHSQIRPWLAAVNAHSKNDYSMAVELAKCARLIKGYGKTRKRGQHTLIDLLDLLKRGKINSPQQLASLRDSALTDTSEKPLPSQREALASG